MSSLRSGIRLLNDTHTDQLPHIFCLLAVSHCKKCVLHHTGSFLGASVYRKHVPLIHRRRERRSSSCSLRLCHATCTVICPSLANLPRYKRRDQTFPRLGNSCSLLVGRRLVLLWRQVPRGVVPKEPLRCDLDLITHLVAHRSCPLCQSATLALIPV